MANEIVLKLAGDSRSLEKSFSNAGDAATRMSKDFDKAQSEAKSLDSSMGKVSDTVDSSESKFMGAADVLDGLATTMGFNVGAQIDFARGMGDIAGGLTNLGPLLSGMATKLGLTSAATWAWNAAQTALNFVLSMNPIALVVIALAALVGGFILAWKHSETFRNVVRGALEAVGGVVGWLRDRFNDLVGFIGGLPGRIGNVARGMFDGIRDAFRGAINWIIDRWNGLQFSLPSVSTPFGKVGGFTLGTPDISRMHMGGIVPGNPGTVVPILAMAGESIGRAGASGGGNTFVFQISGFVGSEAQLANQLQGILLRHQGRVGNLGIQAA